MRSYLLRSIFLNTFGPKGAGTLDSSMLISLDRNSICYYWLMKSALKIARNDALKDLISRKVAGNDLRQKMSSTGIR